PQRRPPRHSAKPPCPLASGRAAPATARAALATPPFVVAGAGGCAARTAQASRAVVRRTVTTTQVEAGWIYQRYPYHRRLFRHRSRLFPAVVIAPLGQGLCCRQVDSAADRSG